MDESIFAEAVGRGLVVNAVACRPGGRNTSEVTTSAGGYIPQPCENAWSFDDHVVLLNEILPGLGDALRPALDALLAGPDGEYAALRVQFLDNGRTDVAATVRSRGRPARLATRDQWTNDARAGSFDDIIAAARETAGVTVEEEVDRA